MARFTCQLCYQDFRDSTVPWDTGNNAQRHGAIIPKQGLHYGYKLRQIKDKLSPCLINFHAIKSQWVRMHSGSYSGWRTCSKGMPIMILVQKAFHIAYASNIMGLACKGYTFSSPVVKICTTWSDINKPCILDFKLLLCSECSMLSSG